MDRNHSSRLNFAALGGDLACILGLLGAVLVAFSKVLFGAQTLSRFNQLANTDAIFNAALKAAYVPIPHDQSGYQMLFPNGVLIEKLWRMGTIPLWNPLNGCGYPLFGALQTQPFSLFHLFGVYSSIHSFDVFIACKAMLAVVGVFVVARVLQLSRAASIFAAVAFVFCPRVIGCADLTTCEAAYPWILLPFVCLAARPSLTRAAVCGLVSAVALSCVQPEECLFAVSFSAWLAAILMFLSKRLGSIALLAVSAVVCVLISAPLTVPFAELIKNSSMYRDHPIAAGEWSRLGAYLAGLGHGPQGAYTWNTPAALFMGTTATALLVSSFAGLFGVGVALGVVWLAALLVTLPTTGLWQVLGIKAIANLTGIHGCMALVMFGSLLSGFGLDTAVYDETSRGKRVRALLVGSGMAIFGALMCIPVTQAASKSFVLGVVPTIKLFLFENRAMLLSCAGTVAVMSIAMLLLLRNGTARRFIAPAGLIALNALCLFGFVKSAMPAHRTEELAAPSVVRTIKHSGKRMAAVGPMLFEPCTNLLYGVADCRNRAPLNPQRYEKFFGMQAERPLDQQTFYFSNKVGRALDVSATSYVLAREPVEAFDEGEHALRYDTVNSQIVGDVPWQVGGDRKPSLVQQFVLSDESGKELWVGPERSMSGHAAVCVPTSLPAGMNVVASVRIRDLSTGLFVGPMQRLCVVKTATHGVADSSGRHFVLREEQPDGARLYENTRALPLAYFVPQAIHASTPEEALRAVYSREFDPHSAVVIESDSSGKAAAQERLTTATAALPIEISRPSPSTIDFQIDAPEDGYAVVCETYYPGWRATVDGRNAPVMHANYLFKAIAVSRGHHTVRLDFQPRSFIIGIAMMICGLILFAVCLVVDATKLRRRPVVYAGCSELSAGTAVPSK